MVQFDNKNRQIKVKIVYYGPALGGKTTSLQAIHRATDPDRRTQLYSLATANDRTLFFDLFSLDLGSIRGYRVALQLYTVPGQVEYNATRRAVLAGVDAVVFVADSQINQNEANLQSLANLDDNLRANGIDPLSLPLVIQFNKRDLKHTLPIPEMEKRLNTRGVPSFPTTATSGAGIMESFQAITSLTISSVAIKAGLQDKPESVRRLQEQLDTALKPYMPMIPPNQASTPSDTEVPILDDQTLVKEAVQANSKMTDLNTELEYSERKLRRKVGSLTAITAFGQELAQIQDPELVLLSLRDRAAEHLKAQAVAILRLSNDQKLKEETIAGIASDILLNTVNELGQPLAHAFLGAESPILINRDLDDDKDPMLLQSLENAGFSSGIAVPVQSSAFGAGLMTLYRESSVKDFDEDDAQLAQIMANTAGIAHAAANSWRSMEDDSSKLERQVAQRTDELRERTALLEQACNDLQGLDRVKTELLNRISHELKTPITSILGAVRILERYQEPAENSSTRFIHLIHEETNKLSEIVQSTIQAAVVASDQDSAECTMIEIKQLLKGAFNPIRDFALSKNIKLKVRAPGRDLNIACTPSSLEVALRAVIKNAIHFSANESVVTISARPIGMNGSSKAEITIKDAGPGIPEGDLPKIFDHFFQGGNLLTEKPSGIGLGLSIAKQVIENHGGNIEVSSELGRGTEVKLTLPAGRT